MPTIIELRHVYKTYDEQQVLRDVNFRVDEGETKIILGGSGQGKSTLLRLILGLEKPDEGEILINGADITLLSEEELSSTRSIMGMVFQESALFDSDTVFDNISYRLEEENQRSDDEIFKITRRFLRLVDLRDEDLLKLPAQLSGGMKRRVAIARAMVGEHKIMLYDEPTAGLDPITARHITDLIIRVRDLQKMTSLVVTQDVISSFQMVKYCAHETKEGISVAINPGHHCADKTRLVILKHGRILIEGGLEDLLNASDSYVQEFVYGLKLIAPK